jgi:hypothetical protein
MAPVPRPPACGKEVAFERRILSRDLAAAGGLAHIGAHFREHPTQFRIGGFDALEQRGRKQAVCAGP